VHRQRDMQKVEKITLPQRAQFFYLRLKIDFSKEDDLPPVEMDSVAFTSLMAQALGSLHGKIGSAIIVDVIKFDPVSMEVIVRVKERYVISVVVYQN